MAFQINLFINHRYLYIHIYIYPCFQTANKKISELEKKIEDLKIQVRHELMKNENIEQVCVMCASVFSYIFLFSHIYFWFLIHFPPLSFPTFSHAYILCIYSYIQNINATNLMTHVCRYISTINCTWHTCRLTFIQTCLHTHITHLWNQLKLEANSTKLYINLDTHKYLNICHLFLILKGMEKMFWLNNLKICAWDWTCPNICAKHYLSIGGVSVR